MKKIYIFLLFILPGLFVILPARQADGQQLAMHGHYFYKPMVYNPAFTGNGDGTNLMVIHHAQWSDFKGAPTLNILTLDRNFMDKKIGLGLGLVSDQKGINNKIGGNLFYSHRLNLNEHTYLSLGLSFGIMDQQYNFSDAIVENATDPAFLTGTQHTITHDGNAGLAFIWKGLELGGAVSQIFGNKIKYESSTASSTYIQERHYIGSLKQKIFFSKEKGISIAPLAIVRFVPNTPLQYDGNINLDFNNKFWIGATYKNEYAVAAHIGFCIYKHFSVGYSYDIILGDIGKYSGLSHEVMVNIKFGKNKKTETKPEPVPEPVAEEPPAEEPVKEEPAAPKSQGVSEKRLDSLLAIKEVQEKEYQKKLKEDHDKLEEERKLKALNDKLAEQITQQEVKTTPPVQTRTDMQEDSHRFSKKGHYVVVGSFHDRNLAIAEVKRLINEGYKMTDWIYLESTQFNYVFIERANSKKDALKYLNDVKAAGMKDSWIHHIK